MPLGTIGGIRFPIRFPLDAEYEFKTETWDSEFGGTRGLSGLEQPYTFEVTVDGEEGLLATVGGTEFNDLNYRSTADAMKAAEERMAGRVPIKAGPHDVTFQIVPPSSRVLLRGTCSRRFAPLPMPRRPLARHGSQRAHQRPRESNRAR